MTVLGMGGSGQRVYQSMQATYKYGADHARKGCGLAAYKVYGVALWLSGGKKWTQWTTIT